MIANWASMSETFSSRFFSLHTKYQIITPIFGHICLKTAYTYQINAFINHQRPKMVVIKVYLTISNKHLRSSSFNNYWKNTFFSSKKSIWQFITTIFGHLHFKSSYINWINAFFSSKKFIWQILLYVSKVPCMPVKQLLYRHCYMTPNPIPTCTLTAFILLLQQ